MQYADTQLHEGHSEINCGSSQLRYSQITDPDLGMLKNKLFICRDYPIQ